jgi:hypothetical protein
VADIRRWLIAAALVLGGASPGDDPVKDVPPPKAWDHFVMLVWQYQTDVTKDQALYESVNLRGFHIDRESDKLKAFAKTSGWPFYVDHAAGKGILHLGKLAEPILRQRDVVVRPNSLADPKNIERLKKLLSQNISSAKGYPVVAYAFDDEISTGNFVSPVETDGSPLSVAAYRRFLESSYGSIQALNTEYGTTYPDFATIEPKSFEAYRAQLKPDALGKINLSPWCDWRSFMDTQWADSLADLTRYSNSLDPDTPAGYVGGHTPCVWGGQDYRKLTRSVQWMEAYDIGATNEILRSFWDQKHGRVQTFFSSKKPRQDSWFLWYYLCHGNRAVICWPEGWFKDGKVADHIAANAETFKEVQGPVSRKIVDGTFVHDPIAIYYSHPSIQMTWALDAVTHGRTWPNRSSSMEDAVSTGSLTRIAWIKTLEDLGFQSKFIHQDHLLSGSLEREGFKVLVLNRALCLSNAEAAAIKAFAAKGGTVVADHLCGIFDEHGKARDKGALDDLFGVRHDLAKGILGGNTLSEVDAEKGQLFSAKNWSVDGASLHKGMAAFERGLSPVAPAKAEGAQGTPVSVRNGRHAYLNLSPAGYLLKRAQPEAKEWSDYVAALLGEAGLHPRVTLTLAGERARMTEAIFWKNQDKMTLCVVQNLERKAVIDGFGATQGTTGDAKLKLKLSFAAPVKGLMNERTGKALGNGRDFEDEYAPWEANVYTYTP